MSYQALSIRKTLLLFLTRVRASIVRILAAYGADCSLRLFATVPKLGEREFVENLFARGSHDLLEYMKNVALDRSVGLMRKLSAVCVT
jgi:hypothetical protein